MFIIDDESHCEYQRGEYATFAEALAELKRRAAIPWNVEPNLAPCMGWRRCGRTYEIVEWDHEDEVSPIRVLVINSSGTRWVYPEPE